jgi:hypothetical protein
MNPPSDINRIANNLYTDQRENEGKILFFANKNNSCDSF